MSSNDDRSIFDPTGMLRGMQSASIAAMTQMLNSEEYTRAMSAMLDSYLATSAPFRALIARTMREFVQSEAYAEATRAVFDSTMAQAAPFQSALAEILRSEAYAQATRAMLDSYLATSAPLREALEVALRAALAGPARGEAGSFAGWLDPGGMLKTMRDASLGAWGNLSPASFQQAIEQSMTQALIQLNMPTRTDVTSIGERLGALEGRIDEIEARLDTLIGSAAKPARARTGTRKAS